MKFLRLRQNRPALAATRLEASLPKRQLSAARESRRRDLRIRLCAAAMKPRSSVSAFDRKLVHQLSPGTSRSNPLVYSSTPRKADFSGTKPKLGIKWRRLALVELATAGAGAYGFKQFNDLFGGVAQPFRIGNDLKKDHALGFDEMMHLQGSYRMTQAIAALYRWSGFSSRTANWIAGGTAAMVMTTLEYIDGRRPNDEASYSDLTANFMGIGLALVKPHFGFLRDVDLRFSYLSPSDPFHRRTALRYNRMTHWLTYDLERQWRIPLYVGIGYGVRHPFRPQVKPEFYFGVGFSLNSLFEQIHPNLSKTFKWLEFYHFGNRMQI